MIALLPVTDGRLDAHAMKKGTGPLRFVLLEDDPNDAELIQLQLAKDGIEVDWRHVVAERDFREALAGAPPDLVLADYTLPGFDGLAALKILLQHSPDIPFIFVSGSLGEERAIEALKSGATDYVLKDRLQRLPAVVMRALTEARERRERREAQAALEEQRVLLSTLIDSLPEIIYAVDTEQSREGRQQGAAGHARPAARPGRRPDAFGNFERRKRRRHRGAGGHDDANRPRAHRPGACVDLDRWLGALVQLHARAVARSRHRLRPGVHGAGGHDATRAGAGNPGDFQSRAAPARQRLARRPRPGAHRACRCC